MHSAYCGIPGTTEFDFRAKLPILNV